jgi:hypothetical protein
MKILIDIPKEFEQHFRADRFEDSLHRLSADAHLIAGLYEQETAMMLIESLKKAAPVPAHGRLVDADKIYDAVEQRYRISSGIEHRCERDLLDLICSAPTIIPAEEDEI